MAFEKETLSGIKRPSNSVFLMRAALINDEARVAMFAILVISCILSRLQTKSILL
jgi:hypothetical protein